MFCINGTLKIYWVFGKRAYLKLAARIIRGWHFRTRRKKASKDKLEINRNRAVEESMFKIWENGYGFVNRVGERNF